MSNQTYEKITINLPSKYVSFLKESSKEHWQTIETYTTEALMEKMSWDSTEEDKFWGELADKEKSKGMTSVEDSMDLLSRMKNA